MCSDERNEQSVDQVHLSVFDTDYFGGIARGLDTLRMPHVEHPQPLGSNWFVLTPFEQVFDFVDRWGDFCVNRAQMFRDSGGILYQVPQLEAVMPFKSEKIPFEHEVLNEPFHRWSFSDAVSQVSDDALLAADWITKIFHNTATSVHEWLAGVVAGVYIDREDTQNPYHKMYYEEGAPFYQLGDSPLYDATLQNTLEYPHSY